jgi:hypothetical protein
VSGVVQTTPRRDSDCGLPGYRLERVLDYIAASLDENISLAQLAAIARMSPHYFDNPVRLLQCPAK